MQINPVTPLTKPGGFTSEDHTSGVSYHTTTQDPRRNAQDTTFTRFPLPIPQEILKEVCPILVGESEVINEIRSLVEKFAPTDAKALITGETGTGKELVAREIHSLSKRKDKLFVAINCAAIPEEILESELFGHEKGAFTDANTIKQGLFEIANGGTLFLDEIGELKPEVQAKLLRALDTGKIRRVGGLKEIETDVRFIAATNKNIETLVKEGKFNRGLRDALNVFSIYMPPLRELKEDIPLISNHLLERNKHFVVDKVIQCFSYDALSKLQNYSFPGNVRELENIIKRAMIFAKGNVIESDNILFNLDEVARESLKHINGDIALCDAPVLISGENGTGKELLARKIHESSYRANHAFVPINCATIKNTLAESELFGHVKGAFTGALTSKIGLFELANQGTLFLDEISELNYEVQTKLLRVIQEGEIIPVGSNTPKKIDVRVIATTSHDLEGLVKSGKFREDLYHRLNVIPIKTIPLRGRNDEIRNLAEFFLAQFKGEKNIPGFTQGALSKLTNYDYPGNIRELRSIIERAVILANKGERIKEEYIHLESALNRKDLPKEQDSQMHPVLSKYRAELIDFLLSNKPLDKDKLREFIVKWLILQRLIVSRFEDVTESAIARDIQVERSTVHRMVQGFGYKSTPKLVEDLLLEIQSFERSDDLKNKDQPPPNRDRNPILNKYLTEFFTYVSSTEPIDLDKAKFLAIKCRTINVIINKGSKFSAASMAYELQIARHVLHTFLKKLGYNSPNEFIQELVSEIQGH